MSELSRVRVWAEALIRLHLDEAWTFDFDRATRRAGACHHTRKRITLSRHLASAWDDDEVHQILLHEVAHALAGAQAGHGPAWRRIAAELGYVGGRTHSGPVAIEQARWLGFCPAGHVHHRFRAPTRTSSCRRCARGFDPAHVITWTKQR